MELQWNFIKNFNYIHIRQPTGFRSFNNVLKSAYQYLHPGGWLEIQDIRFRLHNDSDQSVSHLRSWEKDVLNGAHHLHFDFEKQYEVLMRAQGFQKIMSVVKDWPIGRHPGGKEVGLPFLVLALQRVEPHSLVPLIDGGEGWTVTGVEARNAGVKRDIINSRDHLFLKTYVFLIPIVLTLTHLHLKES